MNNSNEHADDNFHNLGASEPSLPGAPTQARSEVSPLRNVAPGHLLASRYELMARVGTGGMGEVWQARDRQLNRIVAIKRIKSELSQQSLIEQFFREARAVAALNHPHIVQIYDRGSDPAGDFFVMEFVTGTSLAHRLAAGPVPLSQAIMWIRQVGDALRAAHARDIIHRDIKPANILLTENGHAKLSDFGLAQQGLDDSISPAGAVQGTPGYMAPEQEREGRAASPRSDVWSLAATLYQMLTGLSPRVLDLEKVPRLVRNTVRDALQINPEERFASVDQFLAGLPLPDAADETEKSRTRSQVGAAVLEKPLPEQLRNYADFVAIRESLDQELQHTSDLLDQLQAGQRRRRLDLARQQLASDVFRLLILGEFNRGKSTLINALLGEPILPAKLARCTSLITVIKYGEAKRATLYFRDRPGSQEVPIDKINDYITVLGDADEDTPIEQPYSHLEIEYPIPLCRHNVQLADSPGLNEHQTRTDVALDYLDRADAVLVLLSCRQAAVQSELEFLDDNFERTNLRHVFFLWNRFDEIENSPTDIADIEARSHKHFLPRLGSERRIFFVSAKNALLGRKKPDAELLRRSRLPDLEAELERFLSHERGRIKLWKPLSMAQDAVRAALYEIIPSRRSLLEQSLQELVAKYERQKHRFEPIRAKRESMLTTIRFHRDKLQKEVTVLFREMMRGLESGLYQQVTGIGLESWKAAAADKAKISEVITAPIQHWLNQSLRAWEKGALQSFLSSRLAALTRELGQSAAEFSDSLNSLRRSLTRDVEEVSQLERPEVAVNKILAPVGGLMLGEVTPDGDTGAIEFQSAISGVGLSLATGAILLVLNIAVLPILAAMAFLGLGKFLGGVQAGLSRIHQSVADKLIADLRSKLDPTANELSQRIAKVFGVVEQQFDLATAIQYEEVAGLIEGIVQDRDANDDRMQRERAKLDDLAEQFQAVSQRLSAIRKRLE